MASLAGSLPRFKLLIEYAGTRYSGWQIQKNARTVQGEIDRAIREAFRPREFELYGSGRTDAGVHALAQVAHLELYTLARARTAPPEAERRAAGRHPHHRRRQGAAPLPRPARRRVAQLPVSDLPAPDGVRQAVRVVDQGAARLGAMREAAALFVGMKDFRGFTDDDPTEKSTMVLVDASSSRRRARWC